MEENRNGRQHMPASLKPEQWLYLKAVVGYKYAYSPQLARQLANLNLVIRRGRQMFPTQLGLDVAKLCWCLERRMQLDAAADFKATLCDGSRGWLCGRAITRSVESKDGSRKKAKPSM